MTQGICEVPYEKIIYEELKVEFYDSIKFTYENKTTIITMHNQV